MSDPVQTACHCPGTPHELDLFTLADDLPIEAGIAAAQALAGATGASAAAVLIGALLRNGAIESWNLVDEDGPLPVTAENVGKRVTWLKGGVELAGAAMERYVTASNLAPFGLTSSTPTNAKRSRGGRTARSTSARKPSLPEPLEPSAPS